MWLFHIIYSKVYGYDLALSHRRHRKPACNCLTWWFAIKLINLVNVRKLQMTSFTQPKNGFGIYSHQLSEVLPVNFLSMNYSTTVVVAALNTIYLRFAAVSQTLTILVGHVLTGITHYSHTDEYWSSLINKKNKYLEEWRFLVERKHVSHFSLREDIWRVASQEMWHFSTVKQQNCCQLNLSLSTNPLIDALKHVSLGQKNSSSIYWWSLTTLRCYLSFNFSFIYSSQVTGFFVSESVYVHLCRIYVPFVKRWDHICKQLAHFALVELCHMQTRGQSPGGLTEQVEVTF